MPANNKVCIFENILAPNNQPLVFSLELS